MPRSVRVDLNDPKSPAFTTDYEGKPVLLGNFLTFPKNRNAAMKISITQTRVSTFRPKMRDK